MECLESMIHGPQIHDLLTSIAIVHHEVIDEALDNRPRRLRSLEFLWRRALYLKLTAKLCFATE